VKAYLVSQNVSPARQTTVGYGESQPIADNSTSSGKSQNRRVEVAIMANEDLKEAMEKKAEQGG
jgi:outer membrane protein OmpA-like peptidoglycan-associated protein